MEIQKILLNATSAGDFFRDYLSEKSKANKSYSLRALALKLGYSNPSFVSEVIRGKRRASQDLVNRFFGYESASFLEQTYLTNLVAIAASRSATVKNRKVSENNSIREFWSHPDKPFQPAGDPLDCVITSSVLHHGYVTMQSLIQEFGHLIEPQILIQRVDHLVREGGLVSTDGKLTGAENYRTLLTTESYRSILPVLERALTLENKNTRQLILSVALTEENFKVAETIVRNAFEKIALLTIDEEKQNIPADRKALYTIYNSWFRTSKTVAN